MLSDLMFPMTTDLLSLFLPILENGWKLHLFILPWLKVSESYSPLFFIGKVFQERSFLITDHNLNLTRFLPFFLKEILNIHILTPTSLKGMVKSKDLTKYWMSLCKLLKYTPSSDSFWMQFLFCAQMHSTSYNWHCTICIASLMSREEQVRYC